MAQRTHAIIGTGKSSADAIKESLKDAIADGDAVSVVWSGPPTDSVEVVYDYLLDNEVDFTMFYEDGKNPPKVFRLCEHGVTQKSRNPVVAAAKTVAGGGKVLVLWDDDETADYVTAAEVASDTVLFLELSNGLAPLTINDDEEEDEEPEVEVEEEEEDDDENFTREELVAMPAAAVKRYGAKKGAKARTAKGIIDELFPEGDEVETIAEAQEITAEEEVYYDDLLDSLTAAAQELVKAIDQVAKLVKS